MTPETMVLEPNGWVPNNSRLAVLLYRNVLQPAAPTEMASNFERLLHENGWPPQWRNGVSSLSLNRTRSARLRGGSARLALGGPGGQEVRAAAGDVARCPPASATARSKQVRTSSWWELDGPQFGKLRNDGHPAAHKGGEKGGAASASRSTASRSASAKKAAATRKRNAEQHP
jgi:uncharacterized protein YjlB